MNDNNNNEVEIGIEVEMLAIDIQMRFVYEPSLESLNRASEAVAQLVDVISNIEDVKMFGGIQLHVPKELASRGDVQAVLDQLNIGGDEGDQTLQQER